MEPRARFETRPAAYAALAAALAALAALSLTQHTARADASEAAARAARASEARARAEALTAQHQGAVHTLSRALTAKAPGTAWPPALLDALALLPPPARPRVAEVLSRDGTVHATSSRPSAARCGTTVIPAPIGADQSRLVATFDAPCTPATEVIPRARGGSSLALALLPALAAALAAGLAARGAARRIRALALAAERVGNGDLTVRVRPRGDDELDELMRTFNRMVEEMRLTRERVEYLQRVEAWQDFARRLAHEIKNPLTPIQLAVQEVARRYDGDDARFRRSLDTAREVVEEEVATLRRLVTAFSDFARLPEVKTAPGDLAEFVRDMADAREFLDEAGGDARVKIVFEAGDRPIPVAIDRIMLKRAFENLVRNAAQAIGARGGTVWVRAERRRVEVPSGDGATVDPVDQAWLVVEDDGPGIPRDRQSQVFVPYYTTKSEGTGLGLAIVRKVALDHDGDVGCEDRPGGGARFVITLPVRDPDRRMRWSFVTFSR